MDEIISPADIEEIIEATEAGEGFAEEALAGNLEDQPEITLEDLPL